MLIMDIDAMILFLAIIQLSFNVTILESIQFHSRSGFEEEISASQTNTISS